MTDLLYDAGVFFFLSTLDFFYCLCIPWHETLFFSSGGLRIRGSRLGWCYLWPAAVRGYLGGGGAHWPVMVVVEMALEQTCRGSIDGKGWCNPI